MYLFFGLFLFRIYLLNLLSIFFELVFAAIFFAVFGRRSNFLFRIVVFLLLCLVILILVIRYAWLLIFVIFGLSFHAFGLSTSAFISFRLFSSIIEEWNICFCFVVLEILIQLLRMNYKNELLTLEAFVVTILV